MNKQDYGPGTIYETRITTDPVGTHSLRVTVAVATSTRSAGVDRLGPCCAPSPSRACVSPQSVNLRSTPTIGASSRPHAAGHRTYIPRYACMTCYAKLRGISEHRSANSSIDTITPARRSKTTKFSSAADALFRLPRLSCIIISRHVSRP